MKKTAVILLVEDNRMDIELTLDAFKEARLRTDLRVVERGEKALDYLMGQGDYQDREAHPLPHIILLDLHLPGMGGHEVLKKIKEMEVLKRIPVIILTSSREEGDRAVSYDLGANSFLVKPVTFDGFLKVVGHVTEYWLTLNVAPPEN